MRNLYILRGVPGSGKSTFIRENKLENYTVSNDVIRILISGLTYQWFEDENNYVQQVNQQLGKGTGMLVQKLIEDRMYLGLTTFYDATNLVKSDLKVYLNMAKKHRYMVYFVDFDVELETALERNRQREGVSRVPDGVITRMFEIKREHDHNFRMALTPDEAKAALNYRYEHLDKVHVVGDVHASATVLRAFLKNVKPNEKVVFVGDYFDKGIEHLETLDLLTELMENKDIIFLRGNHDRKIEKWLFWDYDYTRHHHNETIDFIVDLPTKQREQVCKKLRAFTNRLRDVYSFESGGKVFIVTHGGIVPALVNLNKETRTLDKFMLNNSWDLMCGVDGYTTDIDEKFNINCPESLYQIHGHRNGNSLPVKNGHSFNLEQKVEYGGELATVFVNNGKINIANYKNTVFDAHEAKYKMDPVYRFIADAKEKAEIAVKPLETLEGVSSYNFTNKAFYNKTWNENTVKARGLFLDEDGKIVARGYDKFFNLNERPELTERRLFSWKFPLTSAAKENGSLGMVTNYNNQPFYSTKKSVTGEYRDRLEKHLNEHLGSNVGAFFERLRVLKATALFEVVDKADPHIISYKREGVVLIGLVRNTWEQEELPLTLLDEFGFNKPYTVTINTKEELVKLLKMFKETPDVTRNEVVDFNEEFSAYTEGVVITDAEGKKVKIKGLYYQFWKRVRGFASGKTKDEFGQLVYDWLVFHNLQDATVLEIRDAMVNNHFEFERVGNFLDSLFSMNK